MIQCQIPPVTLLQFESFAQLPVVHGVFTRLGGVSAGPYASLNVGGTVGDDPSHVRENRDRMFRALGLEPEAYFDVWQVHSAKVVVASKPRGEAPFARADAIISNTPGVALFMRFADCVPVLLFDPVRGVAGLVHAGWLGTVRKVVSAAIASMRARFGCRPEDLVAGIGPSIGPDHYLVGEEVIRRVQRAFGTAAERLLSAHKGGVFLDLWSANRELLVGMGVRKIEVGEVCTACHPEDWYSHRAEGGKTGRFGALLAIR